PIASVLSSSHRASSTTRVHSGARDRAFARHARHSHRAHKASLAAASTYAFGMTWVGANPTSFTRDRKRVNRYSLPTAGSLSKLSIYLMPTSVTGQQLVEGVIYADSSGSPGRLLGATKQIVFHHTDAAGWKELPLSA